MPWLQTKNMKHIHWISEAKARTWNRARDSYRWMIVPSPNFVFEKVFDEGIVIMVRLRDKTTYYGHVDICYPDGSAILSDVRVITFDRNGKRNTPTKKSYVHVSPGSISYMGAWALDRCFVDCVETLDRMCTRSN